MSYVLGSICANEEAFEILVSHGFHNETHMFFHWKNLFFEDISKVIFKVIFQIT